MDLCLLQLEEKETVEILFQLFSFKSSWISIYKGMKGAL